MPAGAAPGNRRALAPSPRRLFIGVQLRCLFGGSDVVLLTAGLSYAD